MIPRTLCRTTWNEHKGGSADVSANHDNERLFRARSVPLSQKSQDSQRAQVVRGERAALQGRSPAPFLRLITDLAPALKKIGGRFIADPSPTGGSMMRIYRDIRFSKDKSPYKTYAAAHFWHANGKDGGPFRHISFIWNQATP